MAYLSLANFSTRSTFDQMGKETFFVWPLWWDITMSRNDGHILPLWWDIWPSLRDIAPIYYPCDGTYDHHYWTFDILLPLWWDIWSSLLDIVHYLTLVMGQMTIITGHCTLLLPKGNQNLGWFCRIFSNLTCLQWKMLS